MRDDDPSWTASAGGWRRSDIGGPSQSNVVGVSGRRSSLFGVAAARHTLPGIALTLARFDI